MRNATQTMHRMFVHKKIGNKMADEPVLYYRCLNFAVTHITSSALAKTTNL